MSYIFSAGTTESIKQVVREVLKEEALLGIHSNLKESEDPDKLKIGMILEGTCKCDESKRDYFAILPSPISGMLNIKCLTRKIGWGDGRNQFYQGATIRTLEGYRGAKLSSDFREYNYRIIPGLTLDTFREVLKHE